jgi:hypothetical protein
MIIKQPNKAEQNLILKSILSKDEVEVKQDENMDNSSQFLSNDSNPSSFSNQPLTNLTMIMKVINLPKMIWRVTLHTPK